MTTFLTLEELAAFYRRPPEEILADSHHAQAHEALLEGLEAGTLRAAQPQEDGPWQAVTWVKSAILLGFRLAPTAEMTGPGGVLGPAGVPGGGLSGPGGGLSGPGGGLGPGGGRTGGRQR